MHDNNMYERLVVLTFLLLEQRVLNVCNKMQHVMCDSREQPSLSQLLKRYPKKSQTLKRISKHVASSQFCDSKISKPSLLLNPDDGWRLLALCTSTLLSDFNDE